MDKEIKLITVSIIIFIFSIQLVVDKSFQPIISNINEENNNNNYFGDLEIIEKVVDKEVKDKIKFEEQVPIKLSEANNDDNNNDGKISIKNEIKERNTNLKIINSNINQNQSEESILKIQ